ncbi:hypothetical protein [Streptomyces sp. NPDC047061]|uniref:hypothetical protein n=1 Tax=Streptomyces sp. NPDC047061 TaxID=3154605 RepID=UPI0033EA290B
MTVWENSGRGRALTDDVWVHYGFAGTGMWISPRQQGRAVLLADKLCCTRDRQPLTEIRNAFREVPFG